MIEASKLTEILREAISDYTNNCDGVTPAEWLQGYLGRNLSDNSLDKIRTISSEITNTIDLAESKKAALDAAINVGESAEKWFTNDAMKDTNGSAEKARMAAEFLNGITGAEQSFDSSVEKEIIDIDDENWNDDEWNDYRLKDSLKGVVAEAGKAGLREIASDAFLKASEEGLGAALGDSDFIKRSLEKGAVTGVKVAVAAGLAVAQDRGVIPPSSFEVLATTAHKTVENLSVFSDVVSGRKTMTEATIEIKNTAVATFSAIWAQKSTGVIREIKDTVTSVFGLKGAIIAGAVTGLVTPPQEGSKLMHVLKETGKSVWAFLTKERHIKVFDKLKKKIFS